MVTALAPSGLPGRIELQLREPLDSARYVFFELRCGAYQRLATSALTHRELEPAPPLSELLAQAMAGAL